MTWFASQLTSHGTGGPPFPWLLLPINRAGGGEEMANGLVEPLGRRLREGDASVLADVLRVHGPSLSRHLLIHYAPLLQAADAEDALSIALFRLWHSRASFNPRKGSLGAWFRKIVLNVARNLVKSARTNRRLREVLMDPADMDRFLSRESEETVIDSTDCAESLAVSTALRSLSSKRRQILLADSVAPAGIVPSGVLAQELGLSPSTVREYRRRARNQVRRRLHLAERERAERERERGKYLINCTV